MRMAECMPLLSGIDFAENTGIFEVFLENKENVEIRISTFKVEARGVEPLSENRSCPLSPSAVIALTFPLSDCQ